MKYYNEKIAGNSKVEFIHVSQDEDQEAALEWATQAKFPWLTVLLTKSEASGLNTYASGTPSYTLVTKHGRVLATTEKLAMEKIKELTEK